MNEDTRSPSWDETPVTVGVLRQVLDAHPNYTVTRHDGPDGNRYMMVQLYDGEPNHQASSEFVEFVSELDE